MHCIRPNSQNVILPLQLILIEAVTSTNSRCTTTWSIGVYTTSRPQNNREPAYKNHCSHCCRTNHYFYACFRPHRDVKTSDKHIQAKTAQKLLVENFYSSSCDKTNSYRYDNSQFEDPTRYRGQSTSRHSKVNKNNKTSRNRYRSNSSDCYIFEQNTTPQKSPSRKEKWGQDSRPYRWIERPKAYLLWETIEIVSEMFGWIDWSTPLTGSGILDVPDVTGSRICKRCRHRLPLDRLSRSEKMWLFCLAFRTIQVE